MGERGQAGSQVPNRVPSPALHTHASQPGISLQDTSSWEGQASSSPLTPIAGLTLTGAPWRAVLIAIVTALWEDPWAHN